MIQEKSAGAVIFNVGGTKIEYLVLQYRHKGWDFPRGGIEVGESEETAALREIREETQLKKLKFIAGFKEINSWFYKNKEGETIKKEAIFFLAESSEREVILSSEHLKYKWLPFREAHKTLSFVNSRMILTQAHHFINNQGLK